MSTWHNLITSTLVRYLAFLWAVESYCWLTGLGFHTTVERFGRLLGFDWAYPPSGEQLDVAIEGLEIERRRYLAKLELLARRRIRQKARERRVPSRDELSRFTPPNWFVDGVAIARILRLHTHEKNDKSWLRRASRILLGWFPCSR